MKDNKKIPLEPYRCTSHNAASISGFYDYKLYNTPAPVPKAGTTVKGRDTSSRHGFVVTYSKQNSPFISKGDIKDRNDLLNIQENICFWCKKHTRQCNDHAHPCVNSKKSEYSYTNALNIVPSCNSCNSKKGGLSLEEWIPFLDWCEEDKKIYTRWLDENNHKLLFCQNQVEYLECQFKSINKIHELLHKSATMNIDITQFINFSE